MTGHTTGSGRAMPASPETLFRLVLLSALLPTLLYPSCGLARESVLSIYKGHSRVIDSGFDIDTVAIGNDNIADVVSLSPHSVLINGKAVGATSLTLLGEEPGQFNNYQVLVEHDLRVLREFLSTIDPAIRVISDPNGDAVILKGKVASRQVIQRAVEATLRFLGTSSLELSSIPGRRSNGLESSGTAESRTGVRQGMRRGMQSKASRDGWITGVGEHGSAYVEKITSSTTRVINLLSTEELAVTDAARLQKLLRVIDERISVNDLNGVFILKGRVRRPVELTRALVLADRFVTGDGAFDFEVISDRGGVLAGALDEDRPPPESQMDLELRGFRDSSTPAKGNLAQNLSRADIVAVADGRVLSLITVDEQPRVEIHMKIVSIDRSEADRLGINWRIQGTKVDIANVTGQLLPVIPSAGAANAPSLGGSSGNSNQAGGGSLLDLGVANLIAFLTKGDISISAFVQALEDHGLAQTISEPLLTSVSGEESSFLVGGEIPLLNGQTNTTTNSVIGGTTTTSVNTIVFREFGIRLTVRPTVLDNGRIAITLDQTLSQPDFNTQLVLGGSAIPGFTKRSVSTYTESMDGETWAVAGLLSAEDIERLQEVPWLSRIPILGQLFRNKSKDKSRKELMITVTARILEDGEYTEKVEAPTLADARRETSPEPSTGTRRDEAAVSPLGPRSGAGKEPWYRRLFSGSGKSGEPTADRGGWRPFGQNH